MEQLQHFKLLCFLYGSTARFLRSGKNYYIYFVGNNSFPFLTMKFFSKLVKDDLAKLLQKFGTTFFKHGVVYHTILC